MYIKIDSPECEELSRSHLIECASVSWGPWTGVRGDSWFPFDLEDGENAKSLFLYRNKESVQSIVLPWSVTVYIMGANGKTVDRI